MAINKVEYGNDVLIDLTGDTVTPYDVFGATFHTADGVQRTGQAVGVWEGTSTEIETIENDLPEGSMVAIRNSQYVEDIYRYITRLTTYSEEERVVGSWFGKPLYRKCIKTSAKLPNKTSITIPIGVSNVKEYTRFGCVATNGTTYMPIPYTHQTLAYQILMDIRNDAFFIFDAYDYSSYSINSLWVEYTKTTD